MGTDTQAALTDEELARQSLAGSLASFEELVHRHEARIYRFVCQRCGNPEDARDITQAAFVSAFRNLRQFTARSSFRSWLYAIARNRTIDALRARRTHEWVDPERLVESADPASALEAHEEADALWTLARGGLSGEQFETLWLRYQEDLSIREVARALRRTETGVKVTLFRARQKLAGLLRAGDEIGEKGNSGTQHAPDSNTRPLASIHNRSLITP